MLRALFLQFSIHFNFHPISGLQHHFCAELGDCTNHGAPGIYEDTQCARRYRCEHRMHTHILYGSCPVLLSHSLTRCSCILFSWNWSQICSTSRWSLLRHISKTTHLFRSCWADKRHGAKWWWHRGQLPRGFPPQVSTAAQANGDRWWTMPI